MVKKKKSPRISKKNLIELKKIFQVEANGFVVPFSV